MVHFSSLVGAAVLLSRFATALPTQPQYNNNYGSSETPSTYGDSNQYEGSNQYDSSSNYEGGKDYTPPSYEDTTSEYEKQTTEYEQNYETTTNKYEEDTSTMYEEDTTTMYEEDTTTSMYEEDTTTSMYETSTSMYEDTTMMNYETTSTAMYEETSTSTTYGSQETSTYGSGSSNWGGSGYNDCVNQCMAEFGSTGLGTYMSPEQTGSSEGSRGTGAVHTVIVAPSNGVLRMVPFATNASVGDTIEFHWGADLPHTVTKSSALTPCNKSNEDPVFASGQQTKGFVFSQVVNDTAPTFYFCGVPGHCDKGMFGIINPAMAAPGSPSSVGGMMSSMAAANADISAYAAYANNVTASNNAAATWGTNFDLGSIPEESRTAYAANVLFARALFGMNPEVLKPDNSIDLSSADTTPLMIPVDIGQTLNSASAPETPANAGTTSAPAGAAAAAAETPVPTGAASTLTSSRIAVAAFVVVATVFAL